MEWKVRLPRAERLARILSAFANGAGGTLLVGVRDDGTVVGVDDPVLVRREILRIAREGVAPPLRLAIRRRPGADQHVVEVQVPASAVPVGVLRPQGEVVPYVREGSSSRPAGTRERRALERGPVRAGGGLNDLERRLLAVLARRGPEPVAALAHALRVGKRSARRAAVACVRAGLVLEKEDGRLWLTPQGHERLRRTRG